MMHPARPCIPHRPPIVFVDEVRPGRISPCEAGHQAAVPGTGEAGAGDGQAMTSVFTVPETSPFLDSEGRLMPEAMLEVMAQCFAAGAGLRAAEAGEKISWGYLAAVRNLQVLAPVFAGDRLTAEAVHRATVGPIHILDCRVLRTGVCIACAELKIFIPEKDVS